MKSNYLTLWRSSCLGVTVFTLMASYSFAAVSDCKNPSEVILSSNVKMKFCEIPEGSASIGNDKGDFDEKPVFKRDFKSFQIGQFTVTQAQYKAVFGDLPWRENDGSPKPLMKEGDNYPAVYVSQIRAEQFARALNLIDPSANYRLPTEAEFEYAARAGTMTNYYWGDNFDPSYAYSFENSENAQHAHDVTTCPVPIRDKKYPGYCANNFGLMHMLGNVWQWTADVYENSYANAPTDGNVAVAGGDAAITRVYRGGSWDNPGRGSLRTSNRSGGLRNGDYYHVGFRLVRTLK